MPVLANSCLPCDWKLPVIITDVFLFFPLPWSLIRIKIAGGISCQGRSFIQQVQPLTSLWLAVAFSDHTLYSLFVFSSPTGPAPPSHPISSVSEQMQVGLTAVCGRRLSVRGRPCPGGTSHFRKNTESFNRSSHHLLQLAFCVYSGWFRGFVHWFVKLNRRLFQVFSVLLSDPLFFPSAGGMQEPPRCLAYETV